MEVDEEMLDPLSENESVSDTPTLGDVSDHPQRARRWPKPTLDPAEPAQAPNPPNTRRRHGYAAVEIHQGAARVIRWEVEDPVEISAEQLAQQRRLFRLGEWLSKQPISDQARAEYFDIERVSYLEE